MPLAAPIQQVDRTFVVAQGQKLTYFGGCDYFRLGSHHAVIEAVREGLDEYGLNVAASRSTTGNHVLFEQLERAVAAFFRSGSAVLVASGYATNIVLAQALAGSFTHALADERCHGSVTDALPFLGCPVTTFKHRDATDLAVRVGRIKKGARILLATDGMFSHDGSAAPLAEYLRLLPRTATVLVDDAHGAGVLGEEGRGAIEHAGVARTRVLQTISLSKAFGVYGGAILCPADLRDEVIARSRLFNGNTPLALPLANAALASVRLLQDHPDWRRRMNLNASLVKEALRRGGVPVPDNPGPIVSFVPRDATEMRTTRRRLLLRKVFPSFIRYPGGPAEGYFRFMISSEHTREQLDALVAALRRN